MPRSFRERILLLVVLRKNLVFQKGTIRNPGGRKTRKDKKLGTIRKQVKK